MKVKIVHLLRAYFSHILVAFLTLGFFFSVYTAFAINYVTPGLTLDPGADFPVLCADPLNDCTTEVLRIGNPVGGATSGSIPFVDASGELAQDNAALFWDETNDRLGIGTNTPAATLDISTFVGTASSVGAANNLGTGIDDLTSSGIYTGIYPDTLYIFVDTLGSPDKFTYTSDNGIYVGVSLDIVSGPIYIGDGVYIEFGSDTGHDGSEFWEIVLTPAIVTSSSGDLNIGGSYFKNGMRWGGAIGGRIDDAQSSGVLFSGLNKTLSQDVTNFAWNDVNNRLSVMNISLPASDSSSEGVIFKNGSSFLHTYRVDSGSNQNLFIGPSAGNFSLTASGVFENANVGIGPNALRLLTSGYFNTATGANALEGNTSGIENTGVGLQAGRNNRTGSYNVAVGSNALFGVGGLSSSNNTAVGAIALNVARGSNNIALGYRAADNLTTGTNNIIIGYDIDAQSPTSANTLSIGNLIFGTGIDGAGTAVSSGNIGIGDASPDFRLDVEQTTDGVVATFTDNDNNCTIDPDIVGGISCTSDARRKENVVTLDSALADIRKLRTVSYDFIGDKDSSSIGFIAQEVEDIYPSLIVRNPNGYLTLSYAGLTPMLTRAIQELDINIADVTSLTGEVGTTLIEAIRNWLADATNGIQNIFAKRVTTEELCVEDVCVTRDQFLQLLENAGVDGGNNDTQPVQDEDTEDIPSDNTPPDTDETPTGTEDTPVDGEQPIDPEPAVDEPIDEDPLSDAPPADEPAPETDPAEPAL